MIDSPRSAPLHAPHSAHNSGVHTFQFQGSGAAFFALVIKNLLLTLLSLGVYLPWAKTERRKYLWQNIEVAGHRLRYHGTGKELLIGYLKVLLGYIAFFGLGFVVTKLFGSNAGMAVQFMSLLLIMPLVPYVIWGSRRYLLSRTSWRGIRFRLAGDAGSFAKTLVFGYLLTFVTAGLYAPIWTNRLYRILTNATALGTKHFEYRGEDKVVFRMALRAIPLVLLTFGLYLFWYQAKLARYRMANSWFDGAQGELELTGGELLQLFLLQVVALTLTLGLAFPWVTVYSLRFFLARTKLVGPVDFARIYQADSRGEASADGLADAFDVGIAL